MSNINNYGVNMKAQMSALIAGTVCTMLVSTSFILPASAQHRHKLPHLVLPMPSRPLQLPQNGRGSVLHTTAYGPMRNTPRPLNAQLLRSAEVVIASLRFEHLRGGASSHIVQDVGHIRIDRQGQTANGDQNIQVQVNGLRGDSTIATVLIPARYLGNNLNIHSQREVANQVRLALRRSLASFRQNRPQIYTLAGRLSNARILPRNVQPRRAGGGFTASCRDINLFTNIDRRGGANLSAKCYNQAGQLLPTAVAINNNIVNNGGRLAWQKDGGFTGSVRNCSLIVRKFTILRCEAGNGAGSWVTSAINLDTGIVNNNGRLTVVRGR
ncbi:CVNH domain-containing protein [Chroococcidiopsis sp. CCNUC1]|uniref:CVNH domain-containing protein n=1 Tax=Chroococcidiopsis sp. CCNUC1 TaxID=2653189 RepID=UPI00202232DE|nr:CVNH domain-containing protein [Chroococcidiopsis sp. CCNUC1]URD53706.1 CVNH domain-containing protein [Chroococcidiopsis sp. CCNUC1]